MYSPCSSRNLPSAGYVHSQTTAANQTATPMKIACATIRHRVNMAHLGIAAVILICGLFDTPLNPTCTATSTILILMPLRVPLSHNRTQPRARTHTHAQHPHTTHTSAGIPRAGRVAATATWHSTRQLPGCPRTRAGCRATASTRDTPRRWALRTPWVEYTSHA